ncbi:mannitol dehydrogenase family protein [Sphingorhabdus sp.]|jgi:fructuronate reductase|uniref:mannitol dehydrogenase family protein n=1 Tax=Sphingorhabdus sp. TaxID=1902408 RepID=UPI0037C8B272
MRLSDANLSHLPVTVTRPAYDREARGVGIVHFGIGAFHRAHQAAYTDDAMAAENGDWRILGVSLRSANVRDQMRPQDGVYSLVEQSADGSKVRVIGSVADVIVAAEERDRLIAALANPATHIVSFTITEKGYCRAPDGAIDFDVADKGSVYAYLADAFRQRRDAGSPGLTLMSCDNLAGNGAQLKRLMTTYLHRHAPELVSWFEEKCACPSTMVDRIVPATTEADRKGVEALTGLRDDAMVVTEPFSQWVIEDNFAGPRPAWEKHGALMTSNVHAYEEAKLRLLNGAHSALAYLGLKRGHEFVHQAIADPELARLANILMRDEAATSLEPAPGQDLNAYADALIARFQNPALNHRLIQIAMDGSQKIPQRWLATLASQQAKGKQCPSILTAIGGWLCHIRGDNGFVDDPLAEVLKATWAQAGTHGISAALFSAGGIMASGWTPSDADLLEIERQL